jgi:mannose-6-phosphate isomerase-like protein (cupin superfamily)
MKTIFSIDIEKETIKNKNYRKVIYTDDNQQLVLMSLEKGEDIPLETHKTTTQFIRVEEGTGYIKSNNSRKLLRDGISVIIPQNTKHYVKQTGNRPLKLYTIYSPPEHSPNKIEKRQK